MSLISWSDLGKSILSFAVMIAAIILFQYVGLDTNFLITFILAMFSIIISISFFISSNRLVRDMNDLLYDIKCRVQTIEKNFNGYSEMPTISDKAVAPKGSDEHE